MSLPTEADTCRQFVLPALYAAGWTDEQIAEQRTFTAGRIVVSGDRAFRRPKKRTDYLLRYTRDFWLAVVEAKASYKNASDGLQQAKEYALSLGLRFAYATNGSEIIEHDFTSGRDSVIRAFPSPEDLFRRYREAEGITDAVLPRLLEPYNLTGGMEPRYYQQIAINRAVQAILKGRPRVLLTLATGTGKTVVAFQIAWKLWNSRWNRAGDYRRPRILYLADRNVLVDVPKDRTFAPFSDARWKIQGRAVKSRELYFSTYQAIARDERRPGLYRAYPPDFFDLVIVDECHRGSARDESNWREILEYFAPAYQLGMTATPLREDNRDTYRYFGNPVYTYSLRQGIEDGFLAPYRVFRVVTTADAAGWRPSAGELDRYGRNIPDGLYGTPDFERIVALRARTEAIARNVSEFLGRTDRFGKTIVFCVDQEHAEEMRRAFNNLNSDLTQRFSTYVVRVVSDEGRIGRGYLDKFMELETDVPVIVTTSEMLTTGVDVQTCKNVVLARVINSMTVFKQIIGRGTRVREDYGKLFFNILDYTGSATRLFADREFDGEPALLTEEEMNEAGERVKSEEIEAEELAIEEIDVDPLAEIADESLPPPRKYYVDNGWVAIAAEVAYSLDATGKPLRAVKLTDYTADAVRRMYPSADELRSKWSNAEERAIVVAALEDRGINFNDLARAAGQPDADPFDLLCFLAFDAPLRTRRDRAERLTSARASFFERYSDEARRVLSDILDKYVRYGTAQFKLPDILEVPPISDRGTLTEITGLFGGPEQLRSAVNEMQALLYAS